jgi:hypothetical protein
MIMDQDKQKFSYVIVTRQKMPSITDYVMQTTVDMLEKAPTWLVESSKQEMLSLIERVKK